LDEPTSNLDPEALLELLGALRNLQAEHQMSVVIIEHRRNLMDPIATRHLEMHDGRLFEAKQGISLGNDKKTPQKAKSSLPGANETLIELRDFTVSINNREIVHLDHFDLHTGEIISLMGPNGSGKTSMLVSLLGLLPSKSDQSFLMGEPIREKLPRDLTSQIGLAFQNPDHQIFCDSVREEITYGPENYSLYESEKSRIEDLITKFGFLDVADRHPYLLSYGQKGRLNMASILSFKPRILLLDEIFIGQDYRHVIFLLETIRNYVKEEKAGAIIVNHLAIPVLEYTDRLVFLEEGQKAIDCRSTDAYQEIKKIKKDMFLMGLYA
jgi:energy-coupling factor transporter ATP-binding protein EcfA2